MKPEVKSERDCTWLLIISTNLAISRAVLMTD